MKRIFIEYWRRDGYGCSGIKFYEYFGLNEDYYYIFLGGDKLICFIYESIKDKIEI